MPNQNLPLQPEPTPEERRQLDELSARLDAWAATTAERVPLPEAHPAPDSGVVRRGGEGEAPIRVRSRSLRPRYVAAGALAASLVGLLYLGGPGRSPPDAGTPSPAPGGNVLDARDLEVASPSPYMIVPTRDPSISIVWLLGTQPTNEGD